MTNPALRILIADEQHFHRMEVERLFNHLGYYRVAPVQNLEELLSLVECGYDPFDLVVINAALAAGSLDLYAFFLDHCQVRHTLIFNDQPSRLASMPFCVKQTLHVSPMSLPDPMCIQRLMSSVDVDAHAPLPEGSRVD
ncbi:chemotaxis protein CheY [Pseudomonas fluorescens]|uniref:chemotaxis protein CheY n=1 Tax=Pseudomonas fluorescens TaxID=294 RepID=UPI00177B49AA|nr:chemotaxis protein CheY [Pseudomonas fluorescens]